MAVLRRHRIKFKSAPEYGGPGEWESGLKEIPGMTGVTIDLEKRDIHIEYDLELCCEEAIENLIGKAGFVLDDSFIQRFKRGLIHYTEENARENLASKPHSCCDVEEIERKRKKRK